MRTLYPAARFAIDLPPRWTAAWWMSENGPAYLAGGPLSSLELRHPGEVFLLSIHPMWHTRPWTRFLVDPHGAFGDPRGEFTWEELVSINGSPRVPEPQTTSDGRWGAFRWAERRFVWRGNIYRNWVLEADELVLFANYRAPHPGGEYYEPRADEVLATLEVLPVP